MDLAALADFVLVASSGGFGRASRKSGRPKATLSRRVINLEQSLGARLFERGGRTLRLTEEGSALFKRSENLLSELREAGETIRAGVDRPRGRLRVTAASLLSLVVLGRLVADFCKRYPEIQLEIVAEDRIANLAEDGFDVALRINPKPDSTLVGRRLLRDPYVLVAPPALARPSGRSLAGFPAVLLTSAPEQPRWEISGFRSPLFPRPVVRFSSVLMVRDAVRAGTGAALIPQSVARADIASGRFVSWGVHKGPPPEIWALHLSRRLPSAKVRAFIGYLAEVAEQVAVKGTFW